MFLEMSYFMNYARIDSILPWFWLLVSTVLLNVSAHRVFGHPVLLFPILTTTLMYISVADFILSRGEVLLLN